MIVGRGAEAVLERKGDALIKTRVPKGYRLPELDATLRGSRTRREAKVLQKMPKGVLAPKLISVDDKDAVLTMEWVEGPKVRDVLDKRLGLCPSIGKSVALLHNAGIIHGDLTTSNMLLHEGKVWLIDFGLSFFSQKAEDKAVDLHLLRQGLESKHHKVAAKAFAAVLKAYKDAADRASETIERLEKVELRGRNKSKY